MSRARLAALATAILALLTVPATAASAEVRTITPDYITVNFASSPDTNLGLLSVDVSSTTPITSLAIHVLSQSTDADQLDPAAQETSNIDDGSSYESVLTVTTPVTPPQLPAGDYNIAVDATDQGGTHAVGSPAGPWEFTSSATLTINASPALIDYNQQTATVSGTVTLHNPDGSQTYYQGPLTLNQGWTVSAPTVNTDATGHFTTTVSPQAPGGGLASVNLILEDTPANRAEVSPGFHLHRPAEPGQGHGQDVPQPGYLREHGPRHRDRLLPATGKNRLLDP